MFEDLEELIKYKKITEEFYNKKEYNILFLSSFTGFLSVYISYKCKLYIHSFFALLLTFSSLCYWYKPGKCARRLFDHTAILLSTTHHLYTAFQYNYKFYFFGLYMIYILYKISYSLSMEEKYQLSSYYHFLVHIFANVLNIMLYIHICKNIK